MKFKDLPSFKKKLENGTALALVVGKEGKERVKTLIPSSATAFTAETFSSKGFLQEVETLPFFEPHRFVTVEGVEALSTEHVDTLLSYIKAPHSKTTLFLFAETLPMTSKLAKEIDKQGDILNYGEEKPWEREKHLIEFAIAAALEEGVTIGPSEAKRLVLLSHKERGMLENEIKKLSCFSYEKKKITHEDISLLCAGKESHTLWELVDFILNRQLKEALVLVQILLEEGSSLFALLAFLRQQFKSHRSMLLLYQSEGFSAVTAQFPYVKEKKIDSLKRYGLKRLEEGMCVLVQYELQAKNSSPSPLFFFELLLEKLCRSSFSPTY